MSKKLSRLLETFSSSQDQILEEQLFLNLLVSCRGDKFVEYSDNLAGLNIHHIFWCALYKEHAYTAHSFIIIEIGVNVCKRWM